MEPTCPYCKKIQKKKPAKKWSYGKMITSRTVKKTTWGPSIDCSRYNCACGKTFNYYLSKKGKSWTIPKIL